MESIKWWKSDTLRAAVGGLIASFVAMIVAIGAIFGVTIDPIMQGKLIAGFMAIFSFGTLGFSAWSIYARLNTTTVIEGSKGEKAVIASTGVVPAPKGRYYTCRTHGKGTYWHR